MVRSSMIVTIIQPSGRYKSCNCQWTHRRVSEYNIPDTIMYSPVQDRSIDGTFCRLYQPMSGTCRSARSEQLQVRFFLSSRYVSPPQVLRKSQKVTVTIFLEINNSEKKFAFSLEFECSKMPDTRCQTQPLAWGRQAAVIGQASPGLAWNAWAPPEQLQVDGLACGLHHKRFLLIFDLPDKCQTILCQAGHSSKIAFYYFVRHSRLNTFRKSQRKLQSQFKVEIAQTHQAKKMSDTTCQTRRLRETHFLKSDRNIDQRV